MIFSLSVDYEWYSFEYKQRLYILLLPIIHIPTLLSWGSKRYDWLPWSDTRQFHTGRYSYWKQRGKNACNFLEQQFGWDWLDNGYIEKINSTTIEIRGAGSNSVLIRLSDGQAIVSYRGKKQADLPVSGFFHKLMVSGLGNWIRQTWNTLQKTHCGVIQQLIFSIISDESIEPDTTRILALDETFWEAIQDTMSQFEHRYNILLKTN